MRRLREDRAEPGHSHRAAIERGIEQIQFSARQHLDALGEREPRERALSPRRRELRLVKPCIRRAAEAVVPYVVGGIEDSLEIEPLCRGKICHRKAGLYGNYLNVRPTPEV